jgi:hypothetical protein
MRAAVQCPTAAVCQVKAALLADFYATANINNSQFCCKPFQIQKRKTGFETAYGRYP